MDDPIEEKSKRKTKASSLRWQILRQALLHGNNPDEQCPDDIERVSRRSSGGFRLIPSRLVDSLESNCRDVRVCYTLPVDGAPLLYLTQRVENSIDLNDFEISNKYNVDNTGLACHWPSEEVLAYFCLSLADFFRSKRVIELGSGYGLAGLVVAATTEAQEVVISDGNPKVVDYIQSNVNANLGAFGSTKVKSMMLHWGQEENILNISNTFDVIIASDCTFFKEFHEGLARIIKLLLKTSTPSEAILLSPRRGDSLDKFLQKIKKVGLHFSITEDYDSEVQKRHHEFTSGTDSWPGYEKDHCFPLLVRITL